MSEISWIAPSGTWPRHVMAGLSCRGGGVSRGPWASLNLGRRTGDSPSNLRRNLSHLSRATGLDLAAAARIRLVHGTTVRVAEAGGPQGNADAVMTDRIGLTLALTVADCVPVVLAHPQGNIALIHCGWRSVAGGILGGTLERLLGSRRAQARETHAWIGPGIGPCCFEVGAEVAVSFPPSHVRPPKPPGRRPTVDLPGCVQTELETLGVPGELIQRSELCTACRPDLFYSHRRDRGQTGRMLAWVVRAGPW